MTASMSESHPAARALPCVIQLGFAGSRQLFEPAPPDPATADNWHQAVLDYLTDCLRKLPEKLGLRPDHFLCGISQIAIGADTVFTEACKKLAIPQRIFLAQPRDLYLQALGTTEPDFNETQRQQAEAWLDSDHIIQERIVSNASDRHRRFEETNLELARVSDVVICLVREDAETKTGGSDEFLEMAINRHVPALVIRVGIKQSRVEFNEQWPRLDSNGRQVVEPGFSPKFFPHFPPKISPELASPLAPSLTPDELWSNNGYFNVLRTRATDLARKHRLLFTYAVFLIIALHIAATTLAASVMAFNASWEFLWLEAIFLGAGLYLHSRLHQSATAELWARSRLVSEILRSLKAIGPRHIYLGQFFQQPRPSELHTLLRTLSVLHLRATKDHKQTDAEWQKHRSGYAADRLDHQIKYYSVMERRDRFWSRVCNAVFLIATLLALTATLSKLLLFVSKTIQSSAGAGDEITEILGLCAIVLPAVALAAMSWSSASELESRVHTFSAAHAFLQEQRVLIERCRSLAEFEKLLLSTETVLLGENVTWYTRRTFTRAT
jgi:hypothetical protein